MGDKKKTAKRFGLKQPKKVSLKMDDLDASSKASDVKGGLTRSALVDNDAHGCPACPHPPPGYLALGGPDTTSR